MTRRSCSSSREKQTATCSRHSRFPNLVVLPYVRGRLAFAEIAARAMQAERFECLAVDLPRFLHDGKLLDAALGLFPLVSSLLIKNTDGSCALLSFTPSDAACVAVFLARKKPIETCCIDQSRLSNNSEGVSSGSGLPLEDDHSAVTDGVEAYFEPSWKRMDSAWSETAPPERDVTSSKAAVVASSLEQVLAKGKKTLFVCEYRLWWAVRKQLDSEERPTTPEVSPEREGRPAALVVEDPYVLWSRGFFDDYPFINFKFYQCLVRSNVGSFDKHRILEKTLAGATSPRMLKQCGSPSMRLLVIWRRYLSALVAASRRMVPLPAEHLLDSARECVGADFAEYLAKSLLQYPLPTLNQAEDPTPSFLRVTPDSTTLVETGFDLPDAFHCTSYYGPAASETEQFYPATEQEARQRWVDLVHPSITRQESREMGEDRGSMRWAVRPDYELHQTVCSWIRDIAKRQYWATRAMKSWGRLHEGIHWKATLSARARGEEALYVKQRLRSRVCSERFDEYTPISFVFSRDVQLDAACAVHDSNIVLRRMELEEGDHVGLPERVVSLFYSVFTTRSHVDSLGGADLQADSLTSLTFLLTRAWMGLERYDAISRQPTARQCRIAPMEDPELRIFEPGEVGLAWAIKYANDAVIAVAYAGWKPSALVRKFAIDRGVAILSVPLSALTPSLIRRLRVMFFISTRLKKHCESEKIVSRFVH